MNSDTLTRLKTKQKLRIDFREPRLVIVRKAACNSSLGFNIVGGGSGEGIYISYLSVGGAADLSGEIQRGDQILSVDGYDLQDATHEEAVRKLKSAGESVQLVVANRFDEYMRYETRMAEKDAAIDGTASAPVLNSTVSPFAHNSTMSRASAMAISGRASITGCYASNVGVKNRTNSKYDSVFALASPARSLRTSAKKSMYVRAQFDYDAARDDTLPSRGVSFTRGAVIHVLNASDEEWWQARLVMPSEARECGLIGIVPSRRRVERKERARLKRVNFDANNGIAQESSATLGGETAKESRKLLRKLLLKGSSNGASTASVASSECKEATEQIYAVTKKPNTRSASVSDVDSDDLQLTAQYFPPIRSYQVVTRFDLNYTRPVVILGPMKDRLTDDLLREMPDRFVPCVPHTSRPARENEVDGRDYHFVAGREQMERQIESHLFVEAGQYNGHLYGTSIAAVWSIAQSQHHCVLDVGCNAVKRLHAAGLFAITILIRPHDAAWLTEHSSQRITEEQAFKQLEKCARIEHDLADLITATIVASDTYQQLLADVKRVVRENSGRFIWIPSNEPV